MIEDGAAWPRALTQAKGAYLAKEDTSNFPRVVADPKPGEPPAAAKVIWRLTSAFFVE